MIDWSATAAWIALVISITGTVLGPIVTTVLTNRHQLHLRKIELQEKQFLETQHEIRNCISCIGAVMAVVNSENLINFGKYFPSIYSYVPVDKWTILDEFQSTVLSRNDIAIGQYEGIIHLLTDILKSAPR